MATPGTSSDSKSKTKAHWITRDLESKPLILLKGFLFLGIAGLSALALLLLHPEWITAILLASCLWGACRFYYFCFYVIEKYVDPTYRFSGILSFLFWLYRKRSHRD